MSLHTITEHINVAPISEGFFATRALESLLSHVEKIVLHMDGAHGVHREYCDSNVLIDRAKKENCLLLDLGHVVRLYFGDDYFDLRLETKISCERSELLSLLVDSALKEIEGNTLV